MKLYWLDIETTGLDPNKCTILEVAVAEADLRDPFSFKHIYNSPIKFESFLSPNLDPYILKMHTTNGLLDECGHATKTLSEVENDLLELIPHVENKAERPILAGSSIHFDHSFIRVHMFRLAERLSHRHYDVSAIKLFCQSMGMETPPKAEAHRAKDDIEESIAHCLGCYKWLQSFGFGTTPVNSK